MKKFWRHGSSILLVITIAILLVPSWRVSFQGWFQGIFMSDLVFEANSSEHLPIEVIEWEIKDMNETSSYLGEHLGRPILISFWATWCPPCRAELSELKALKDKYGDSIHFLSVSEEAVETITASHLNEDYDFLFSTYQYPRFFAIEAYPTLCIIDKNGKLIFKHSGSGGLNNEKNYQFVEGLIQNQ